MKKLKKYLSVMLIIVFFQNAWLSAVPFLCMWFFTMVFASLLDHLRARQVITTGTARKLATSIG